VTELPTSVRRGLLLRSFLVQGSWNYETLIGTGFAFVMLPVLRHVHRDDPEALRQAVERHSEVFNSHPYMATLAAGAVARLEIEGTAPSVVTRFKSALRGSLGALGDQLVWLSFRPAVALVAIMLLLLGAPWWVAVAVYLVTYNSLHFWLRLWGFALGLRHGLAVGGELRAVPLGALAGRAAAAGMVLAGVAAVLAVAKAGNQPLEWAIAAASAVAGGWLGLRARQPAFALLLAVWLFGMTLGLTSR